MRYKIKTVLEGKKLNFCENYEIQLLDMRSHIGPSRKNVFSIYSSSLDLKSGRSSRILFYLKFVLAPLFIISGLAFLLLLVTVHDRRLSDQVFSHSHCFEDCKITLAESIPENMTYPGTSPQFASTYSVWKKLLTEAKTTIDFAVFYWSLNNEDVTPIKMPSAWEGEDIFKEILRVGKTEVKIRIAQNSPSKGFPQNNSKDLEDKGAAKVRSLDFDQLMGAGVLHTKMWLVDGRHAYIGSANMDWQSLTQVKEVGMVIQNCPCLVEDMQKIFEVYWLLGNRSQVPSEWPLSLETKYNVHHPLSLTISGWNASAFVASSPQPFNPGGRTNDVDAVVSIIRAARQFVFVAVMDYFPRLLYTDQTSFWPVIDDELRRAAIDWRVDVRLLASRWNHTRQDMVRWLKSLRDISSQEYPFISIQTKLFEVPVYTKEQSQLPFARVNHNKYMVTDKTAYVGTSNWSGDYFTNTAGVSLSVSEKESAARHSNLTSLRQQLESLFLRDWNSPYAKTLDNFL